MWRTWAHPPTCQFSFPQREHLSESMVRIHRATLCSFGRNIRPLWWDCVTCSTNSITSFSTMDTHTSFHRDSEEPSSHITQCILHTALKRQNLCDHITVIRNFNSDFGKLNRITVLKCLAISKENLDIQYFPVFAFELHNFPLFENTSTCKTSGFSGLRLCQKVLTLNLIHSE